ncbi:MAG: outer membrane protein [Crocinitomix sp.]|jgi:outer membrane protein
MKKLGLIISIFFTSFGYAQDQLTVFGAIEKALTNNYEIKLVDYNYQVSKLQNSWGQAGMVPTFYINVGNTASLQDNTNNPATFFPGVLFNDNLQASLNMSWTIFNGFGIRINKERFDQMQAQTKGNAVIVIENTIYDVILAYYTAVVQERKLNVMHDLLDYSKEKLEYNRLKNDMGINTSFDLLEFESLVLTDSSNYLLQELSYLNAQRNLNLIMAEEVEARYELTDSLGFPNQTKTYEELKENMVADNQNLKNQFINYELQELNVRAKKSAYYPIVTMNMSTTPSVGYFRLFGDEGFSSNTSAWTHSGNINVRYDIFQGWNRKRNSEIAAIQLDMAGMQVEQLTMNLSHQLKGFYELYQTRMKVESMSLKRMEHANKLWELGREKYDLGLINVFNLNDIKLAYEQTLLNYYDRLFELLQSHYDLMRLTGGISQEFKIAENFDNGN